MLLTPEDRSLTVSNDTTINCTDVVRGLGVFFDTELSMKQHVAKVSAASCMLLSYPSSASTTSSRWTGGYHASRAGHDYVTS